MDDDPRFVALDDLDTIPAESNGHGDPAAIAPLALDVDSFIANEIRAAPPLLGTEDEAIFPAGGLIVVAGQAGIGKTTLVLDGIFHLASGMPWLNIPCARPLSVLIVENEGPREQFRRKLAGKRSRWPHELKGNVWVQTWRWGSFSITDAEAAGRLAEFADAHEVDMIVGDPLGTLGIEGVGSPEDTREFVKRLMPLGLGDRRAFLFLSHFRKDKATDEIDQLSGAWGPHLDTLLVVKAGRKDQMRLSFPKLRWAASEHKPIILNRVRAIASFEFDHVEGDPKALIPEVVEYLEQAHEKGPILSEIAKAIGARRDKVQELLEGNDHLFQPFTGTDAKERGRTIKATVWGLVPGTGTGGTGPEKPLQNGRVAGVPDDSPSLEGRREEGTHQPSGQPGLFAVPDVNEELEWK